ncbi:MAG TPA: 50S ribosomal protein L6 [Candidatus Thermoplasmatota archaeon]|nr:50S ribosomal protein L6 [Candidatus Thermoplasmatota archaeon]
MVSLPETKDRIKIPDGITAKLDGRTLKVKGPKGELQRTLKLSRVELKIDAGDIVVRCDMPRRAEKAEVGTFASHVRNMLVGVQEGYEYRLKTVFAHFPIKSTVKGETFLIENFLGERSARKATILAGVKVDVKGDQVTVTGIDLEKVSQTAANIETATHIRNRDIRVFQDGIYIVQKAA